MLRLISILVTAVYVFAGVSMAAETRTKPNIVFVLADDLGYGDLGCFGQKRIRTPHLDRLAAEGMRFTQHYAGNAVCAPSRCVLLTGKHPGHAFIRENREVKPEGQLAIPGDTVTMAKLLRAQGYVTGAFGKWGLGGPASSGDPLGQGFDRFFGYNCQRVAHNYYPPYLWDNNRRVPLNNPEFSAHQTFPTDKDPHDPASYLPFAGKEFAPDRIAEEAIRFVRENKDHPFFLYFPTTVPHLALQVPEDSLMEYAGKFPEEPYLGDRNYLPHRLPRAAYAAMVTRMDRDVGRLISLIDELGLAEQTIFVFTSDNGPLYDRLGGTDTDFFDSAGGFRGRKGALYEGGIRVPCIVRWKGTVATGTTSEFVSGFEDWLPTFLDLAGASHAIPADVDGISLQPALHGGKLGERPFLYREFQGYGGWQSVRLGDWKAVRQQLHPRKPNVAPELRTELYDLAADPTESKDVAAEQPGLVAKLERILAEQHTPSREFPMRGLDKK